MSTYVFLNNPHDEVGLWVMSHFFFHPALSLIYLLIFSIPVKVSWHVFSTWPVWFWAHHGFLSWNKSSEIIVMKYFLDCWQETCTSASWRALLTLCVCFFIIIKYGTHFPLIQIAWCQVIFFFPSWLIVGNHLTLIFLWNVILSTLEQLLRWHTAYEATVTSQVSKYFLPPALWTLY